MSNLDLVLDEIKNVLRVIPEIRKFADEPGESAGAYPYCIVYPGAGSSGIKSSFGPNGYGNRWESNTAVIDVYKNRQNLPKDMEDMRPFVWLIPNALFAAWARDQFNKTVLMLGDLALQGTGGGVSTSVLRRDIIFPQKEFDAVGYRFELDFTIEEDIIP